MDNRDRKWNATQAIVVGVIVGAIVWVLIIAGAVSWVT